MNRTELISYSLNFTSFLLKSRIGDNINQVILFGSVPRGDFDKDSDIDLFIDTKTDKKTIEKLLEVYKKSEDNAKYALSGINNQIRAKVGSLNEWKGLKRSIISDGIMLYGKYKETPENLEHNILFNLKFSKMQRNKQVRLWRKLYGYNQKIGNKNYAFDGIVKESDGKKIGYGTFIIPIEKSKVMTDFLKKEKINYSMKEIFL